MPQGRAVYKRSDIKRVHRGIHPDVKFMLAVRTAGRCEFRNCNAFLFRHPITGIFGNFAEHAHVIAFSPDGPRGRVARRPRNINDISNLMLLCQPCHKLIDDRSALYPIRTLREYKRQHETRISVLTGAKGTNRTRVIKLVSRVRGHNVEIPDTMIFDALQPRFSDGDSDCEIDLTGRGDLRPQDMPAAATNISSDLERFFRLGRGAGAIGHVSVFAVAPIPLLVHLGSQLSTKVTTDLFQRHRDTESWMWKPGAGRLRFACRRLKKGGEPSKVALIVSVSGRITPRDIPAKFQKGYFIYEIRPALGTPRTDLLKTRGDLDRFRDTYEGWQGSLSASHGQRVRRVDVFAAAPIPVAIMLGYARLPQVAPRLRVYENEPLAGGFKMGVEVG